MCPVSLQMMSAVALLKPAAQTENQLPGEPSTSSRPWRVSIPGMDPLSRTGRGEEGEGGGEPLNVLLGYNDVDSF